MMRRSLRFIALAAWAVCSGAHALTIPASSPEDAHLQHAPLTDDIVAIQSEVGRMTVIRFGKGEVVQNYGMGDADAWAVVFSGNELDFVPKAQQADTNLRVITNRRSYWFSVALKANAFATPSRDDAQPAGRYRKTVERPKTYLPTTWQLNIDYPPAEVAKIAADDPAVKAAKTKHEITSAFDQAKMEGRLDADYGYIGDDELLPTAAYNNGKQTFIVLPIGTALPTVYEKTPDGTEVRVGAHMDHDMMVIHDVARKLVLRRGRLVGCLIDGHYNPTGPDLNTETVSPDVKRVLNTPGGEQQ